MYSNFYRYCQIKDEVACREYPPLTCHVSDPYDQWARWYHTIGMVCHPPGNRSSSWGTIQDFGLETKPVGQPTPTVELKTYPEIWRRKNMPKFKQYDWVVLKMVSHSHRAAPIVGNPRVHQFGRYIPRFWCGKSPLELSSKWVGLHCIASQH